MPPVKNLTLVSRRSRSDYSTLQGVGYSRGQRIPPLKREKTEMGNLLEIGFSKDLNES